MTRHIPLALTLAIIAVPAFAQSTSQAGEIQFLSQYAFHINAERLSSRNDDRRFVWAADFGAELDVVDYGRGRATFLANYEVILGNEFRRFDPNQSNYQLDGSTSLRVRGIELAAVFHHVSRHLTDRFKRPPVDWNMLGARVLKDGTAGRLAISARADVYRVLKKALVDYRWEAGGDVSTRYSLRPHVALVSSGAVRVVSVDDTRARDAQVGFRSEAGVRLDGRAGAVELFLAAERRIDPYPLQASTDTWMTAGFRFLSR